MRKLLNACLLLTSLIGYLEWGKGMHAFLFEVEYQLLFVKTPDKQAFMHPFVLVPIVGQLLLLFTLFQKVPSRWVSMGGLLCLSLIMVLIFIIGIMGMNIRILLSAVPFIVTGIWVIWYNRKHRKEAIASTAKNL